MTDAQPTEALDLLLHLTALLEEDQARFHAEHGLTGPRVHLLWVLGSGGPSTQRSLADALRVTPRNITGLVDGLAASGHVSRAAHPADRRATLVTLTPMGEQFVQRLQREHTQLAADLFGDLSSARLADLVEVLGATAVRVQELMAAEAASR